MKFDSIDILSQHRVGISNSLGNLDILKRKSQKVHKWDDEHGMEYNADNVYFQERSINLEGWVMGSTLDEFEINVAEFQQLISRPGLHCIEFTHLGRPYYCYAKDGLSMRPVRTISPGINAAKFKLTIVEPEPYSPVFYYTANKTVSFSFSGLGTIRIYWGDGTWDDYLNGATASHTYKDAGTYGIGVVGAVSEISSLTAISGTMVGDLGLITRGLSNLGSLALQSQGVNSFKGGVIPIQLANLDLGSNNLNQAAIDRVLKYLYFDGTNKVADRVPALNVDLSGMVAPSAEGLAYKTLCDPEIGTITLTP